MLVPLSNDPRDYAWGSATLLAELEGRSPSGRAEAEVWFGDHPGDPAVTADGRTLDAWLEAEGPMTGAPARLPYLLKLLAAASALSIQAHPSKAQAETGFAREEAAGIARDAAERTYRDDNHKPELLVAMSEEFRALAGLRDLDATRRLLEEIGPGARSLAERLEGEDAALGAAIGWLLSEDGAADARDIVAAASAATSIEFAAELEMARGLEASTPGDPGIVVALLMNLVTLRRGEGLFVPAGVLHAYLEGLGVELMAASDNVLRGGLTPKHIDVPELLSVLDETPGAPMIVQPREVSTGVDRYDVPVPDFALFRARAGAATVVAIDGPAIAVSTGGAVSIEGRTGTTRLAPGGAVFVTPDEHEIAVRGDGEVFVAVPG
ncbi:phosphoheptose isomerase [Microbacterium sp. Root166]|uniref:mannose-6-phosphate isomerase, class I n=1 Tax=Microbacterium sp. Root166 TaxID=1736478 RepID=UPI0006FB8D3B|nr:mannose-6-phosphate isomerase, class I [Microbacterium sp. Root166]KQZ82087.1 phosphoheptose isomerase [Microbacterium sp. Root166]